MNLPKFEYYDYSHNTQQDSNNNISLIPYKPPLDEKKHHMFKGTGITVVVYVSEHVA